MKKLVLLIPTMLVTAFLALAFLLPGAAAGVLRSVAPSLQVVPAGVLAVAPDGTAVAGSPAKAGAAPGAGQGSPGSGGSPAASPKAPPITSNSQQAIDHGGHSVATFGHTNCGRFGNGHHGGKHDFTCPNRPFPEPVISHS
jgi:hypothetical protein